MTALRPVETHNVVAVASEEYPSNRVCAHPECSEPVELRPDGTPTVHHAFSRSKIKSASYFVSIEGGKPIPHAVGIHGSGTTGHHGDLEEQRARLVLEEGVWYWEDHSGVIGPEGQKENVWVRVGPLNPQPGSVEGKTKTKKRLTGEARRSRAVISLKVPKDDQEDGSEVFDTILESCREEIRKDFPSWKDSVPPYHVIVATMSDWLNGRGKTRRARIRALKREAAALHYRVEEMT